MSSEPLSVETGGLRAFSRTHADIATDISRLADRAPDGAEVATTHGTIGFGMQTALKDLLTARLGSLQATAGSGDSIAEILQKAAKQYDGVDDDAAQKIEWSGVPPVTGIRPASGSGLDIPFPDITTTPPADAPLPVLTPRAT